MSILYDIKALTYLKSLGQSKNGRPPMRTSYLVSGPSVDDGLDEDAEVITSLPGLVALQADPKSGRTGFVEGDLVHQLLPAVVQHQAAGLLALLTGGKKGSKETVFLDFLPPENAFLLKTYQTGKASPKTCFT